jgi:altronate hydrolase
MIAGGSVGFGLPRAQAAGLTDVAVRLNDVDHVAIAKTALAAGSELRANGETIRVQQLVPAGHKLAVRAVEGGQPVRRYGQVIGCATQEIEPGEHVHSHNLAVPEGGLTLDYAFCSEASPVRVFPEPERRTFLGYRRPNGRVGTRNYVAVLASVNCSSSATRRVAEEVRASGVLERYPNVDGVLALPVKGGCGAHLGSQYLHILQRTLTGIVDHPNVGAYVVLSLGCEVNEPEVMLETGGVDLSQLAAPILRIQSLGGFRETVRQGVEAVEGLLPLANETERKPVPASELIVALQCGGSDSWSGVTANPALGLAADEIVRQGGTAVLGETTEVYGGEHLLTRRARRPEVAEKLLACIRWWEEYTRMFGASIDNNPSPGNKLGGLTTIYEKSLGAIAKAGSTPLMDVVGYGERIKSRGLVHMDSPGYDPVSVTGQVAGGCNLVAFTTGRGSSFGFKPAPSLKIASNSELYSRQEADMDVDAGQALGGGSLEEVGREIFERLLAVASGERTKSEADDIGEEEFNPWILGVTL